MCTDGLTKRFCVIDGVNTSKFCIDARKQFTNLGTCVSNILESESEGIGKHHLAEMFTNLAREASISDCAFALCLTANPQLWSQDRCRSGFQHRHVA